VDELAYLLINALLSLMVSASTGFLVSKYYGERWVEKRRSRMEHSIRLKDGFFKPWLEKIGEHNDEYCKIGAQYSKELGKMSPLKPREPDNIQFYEEAMSHLKDYDQFLKNWGNLKQITLKLNEKLAILFEEIIVLVKKEIDVPYWCPGYSGDEPDDYLCPDTFSRAIYEEVEGRLKTGKKQFIGYGVVVPEIYNVPIIGEKKSYRLDWGNRTLARILDKELMDKTECFFWYFVDDAAYRERISAFMAEQKETYDKELERVRQGLIDTIKSIELGNTIKGKCRYCP